MAITTQIIVVGNLVRDPELRYTKTQKPVVSITIASTPRALNRATGKWEDGEPVFMRCSAWDDMAEHIAHSLKKGDRVLAAGVLKASKYNDREGNAKESLELQIDEIGPSLKFANASPQKGDHSYTDQIKKADNDGWVTVDDDTPF
jgi:single-strand DNA-binding protein